MDPASERSTVLGLLEAATVQLLQSLSVKLVPRNGAQLGFAIRGARDAGGVAAVAGRIVAEAGKARAGGACTFGTDEEIARAILTVMKFDPRRRSAGLVRFSDRAIRVLEDDLFLECCTPDAADLRPGISTMDWGVAACCKGGVPDVIYFKGRAGTEGTILVIGEDPADVANNIIITSNRL